MPKIGFHKLGFSDPSFSNNDTNGMFTEVNLIMAAFKECGHDCEYVNTTNYPAVEKTFDIIYVFNGFENSTSNLEMLDDLSKELNYILTDTRFYNDVRDNELIDNYFIQGPMKMFDGPTYNSMLHKLPIYDKASRFRGKGKKRGHSDNNSIERVVFGGSVRERKAKIYEYIMRPETTYFLRFDDFNIDTRIPIEKYREELRKHVYGIVLINPKDAVIGSITWRYYEYITHGCLTFVDRDSDPNFLILPEDSFMRVSSYEELVKKQLMLNNDPGLRRVISSAQNRRIIQQDRLGVTFVEALLEKRYLNDR